MARYELNKHPDRDKEPGEDTRFVLALAREYESGIGVDPAVARWDQVFRALSVILSRKFNPDLSMREATEFIKTSAWLANECREYGNHELSYSPRQPIKRILEIVRREDVEKKAAESG